MMLLSVIGVVMHKMAKLTKLYYSIKRRLSNNKGQGMLEYILIVILIGITLVTVLGEIGTALDLKLNDITDVL